MSATHPHHAARLRACLQARVPSRPGARDATAHDLLGVDHPLARAEARVRALSVQSAAVSSLAVFNSLAWLLEPAGRYAVLLGTAAVVEAVLAVALVLTAHAKRDTIVRLIAEGRGGLPLETVARARRRLLRPEHRERLARAVDQMRREVARPLRGELPLYSRSVVGSVDRELASVARLLRAPHASADGVAMAQLVLSSESSPLYGSDPEELRQELGRLTFMLGAVDAHETA
jgi:hypothetical protein